MNYRQYFPSGLSTCLVAPCLHSLEFFAAQPDEAGERDTLKGGLRGTPVIAKVKQETHNLLHGFGAPPLWKRPKLTQIAWLV